MKKRLLSLSLALALCLGLAVPAFAETVSANCVTTTFDDYSDAGFKLNEEEQLKSMSLTYSIGDRSFYDLGQGIFIERAWTLRNYYNREVLNYDGYFAVRHDTVFTVTNASPAEEYSLLTVDIQPYIKFADGTYREIDDYATLTHRGNFEKNAGIYGWEMLFGPGGSIQFVLPLVWDYEYGPGYDPSDIIYELTLSKHVYGPPAEEGSSPGPTIDAWISKSVFIKVDDAAVNSYLTNSSAVPVSSSFSDVPAGEYYAEPVKWAVAQGITNGTTSTTFSPGQTCTQAQILTFLHRAAGKPSAKGSVSFPVDEAYREAVCWAADMGMIDRTSFQPDKPCTRGIAMNYFWHSVDDPYTQLALQFTDVSRTSPYIAAVSWAVQNGITTGTSPTTFSPDEICTRGQIVTFLYRAKVRA